MLTYFLISSFLLIGNRPKTSNIISMHSVYLPSLGISMGTNIKSSFLLAETNKPCQPKREASVSTVHCSSVKPSKTDLQAWAIQTPFDPQPKLECVPYEAFSKNRYMYFYCLFLKSGNKNMF